MGEGAAIAGLTIVDMVKGVEKGVSLTLQAGLGRGRPPV
jgi:molybdenum cofactor biosynthesis enzyme